MKPTIKDVKGLLVDNLSDNFKYFVHIIDNDLPNMDEYYVKVNEDINNLHIMFKLLKDYSDIDILKNIHNNFVKLYQCQTNNRKRTKNYINLQIRKLEGEL